MKEHKKKKHTLIYPVENSFSGGLISLDPLGSYTGRPIIDEKPVQDADDL